MFKTNRRNQTPRNLVAKLMGWNADANALEQRIVPAYVAGDFGWASTFETGNVNIENVVRSTVVDNSGNVYQVGSFTGTVDFDPGAGTTNLTAVGGQDAFVEKLDSTGKLLWVKTLLPDGIKALWILIQARRYIIQRVEVRKMRLS